LGEEAVRFDNPVLPETRSEMALPLRSRGKVIGAMSVQSTEEAAFDETDISVMQTMAIRWRPLLTTPGCLLKASRLWKYAPCLWAVEPTGMDGFADGANGLGLSVC
jgi:signal transduction protein with GAF and PtsI domain